VGASGVMMFSSSVVDWVGAQDTNKIAIITKFKKHRVGCFPLCFRLWKAAVTFEPFVFVEIYSSLSSRITTASDWLYKSAVITLSPLTSFP